MATDKLRDDWEGPTDDELLNTLSRAMRRLGAAPPDPLENATSNTALFASAGLKLKGLREGSGWTVAEISERTGIDAVVLEAFENGDFAAAGKLTTVDLERLASACCGTLADLLGSKHLAAHDQNARGRYNASAIDPWG